MKVLTAITAGFLLLSTGIVHGLWTDRWSELADLAEPVQRLENLPGRLGDWEAGPLEKLAARPAGLAGAVTRRYVHRFTGKAVTVYLACGRGGPASIHTPDVCYAASGYTVGRDVRHTLEPGAAFLTADLRKPSAPEQPALRIFWSFSGDGTWQVADSPRLAFARRPLLYKLYLIGELGPVRIDEDPCLDLARRLLPDLRANVLALAGERGT